MPLGHVSLLTIPPSISRERERERDAGSVNRVLRVWNLVARRFIVFARNTSRYLWAKNDPAKIVHVRREINVHVWEMGGRNIGFSWKMY